MKEISIFDVIGPNMIGPSSSHTAGALRIAAIARKMVKHDVKKVIFNLYGSFAKTYQGHGSDKALVAGMLGFNSDDERIRDAFTYAKEVGLQYQFVMQENKDYHPNTVMIEMFDDVGMTYQVRGESIGGGEVVITNMNGVDIRMSGAYDTILVKQIDEPGVLLHITTCLAQHEINIAFMKLYREEKGKRAYTIVEVDNRLNDEIINQIETYDLIDYAVYIRK